MTETVTNPELSDLTNGDIISVPHYANNLRVVKVTDMMARVEFTDRDGAAKDLIANQNSGRLYLIAGSTDKGAVDELTIIASADADAEDDSEDGDSEVPGFYCPGCEDTKDAGCPYRGRTICHDCLDDGERVDLIAVEEREGYIPSGADTISMTEIQADDGDANAGEVLMTDGGEDQDTSGDAATPHTLHYENRLHDRGHTVVKEVEVRGEVEETKQNGVVQFEGRECDQEIGGTGTFLINPDGTVDHVYSSGSVQEVGDNASVDTGNGDGDGDADGGRLMTDGGEDVESATERYLAELREHGDVEDPDRETVYYNMDSDFRSASGDYIIRFDADRDGGVSFQIHHGPFREFYKPDHVLAERFGLTENVRAALEYLRERVDGREVRSGRRGSFTLTEDGEVTGVNYLGNALPEDVNTVDVEMIMAAIANGEDVESDDSDGDDGEGEDADSTRADGGRRSGYVSPDERERNGEALAHAEQRNRERVISGNPNLRTDGGEDIPDVSPERYEAARAALAGRDAVESAEVVESDGQPIYLRVAFADGRGTSAVSPVIGNHDLTIRMADVGGDSRLHTTMTFLDVKVYNRNHETSAFDRARDRREGGDA